MGRIDDTKAAMSSCVSVLAAVFGQPEPIVTRWLDLYYQVRRTYEIERGADEDPRLIRREDLGPAIREAMREAAKAEAGQRQKQKAAATAEIVQEGTKKPSGWTLYKRKVSGKLADARAAGISIAPGRPGSPSPASRRPRPGSSASTASWTRSTPGS